MLHKAANPEGFTIMKWQKHIGNPLLDSQSNPTWATKQVRQVRNDEDCVQRTCQHQQVQKRLLVALPPPQEVFLTWWKVFCLYLCLKRAYPEIHWCIIIVPNKHAIWEVYQYTIYHHYTYFQRQPSRIALPGHCALSKPCSAAFVYHLDAFSRSAGRPLPQWDRHSLGTLGTRVAGMCMLYTEYTRNIMIYIYICVCVC